MMQKSSKGGRRPSWKSREVLAILKWKKEVYGMLKKGQVHERSIGTSLGVQGCDKEGHSPLGIESGKGYQEQEWLLQVYHQQNEGKMKGCC